MSGPQGKPGERPSPIADASSAFDPAGPDWTEPCR